MIRTLTILDDPQVQALIQQKPAENLFLIGDIEAFGYEQDFQTIWGDFDTNNQLRAILLKYERNYIPFAVKDFDAEGFAAIINRDSNQPMLSGLKELVTQLDPYLTISYKQKRQTYYAKCTSAEKLVDLDTTDVKKITLDDVERLGDFLANVPEFELEFNPEKKRRNIQKGVSRGYYIEQEAKIISSASTTAENKTSAMVVAVATARGYQQRGLATRCLVKLCDELLSEGKQLCLFYDNPNAGKLYKRLGFEDIGFWMMYR